MYISNQLKKIDDEEKIKLYRLSFGDIDSYYKTVEEVKAALRDEIENNFDDDVDNLDAQIKTVFVPESEVSEYVGKIFV